MNDHWRGPLDQVPFRVTNPEQIPTQRYYDQAFFDLERERLWPHVWQMAARLEEIPEVGDYVEYKILDKSVIVVRAKSGVKAFHNSCRHRGVQLASGMGNCEVQGFQCPFHGWRWNIEGENTFVFKPELFSDEQLDRAELDLVPCRVELWGGCAFINFDDEAAPFIECIKPYAARLDPRNVEQMKIDWWLAAELPVNWKLAMEAFMEGYHNTRTHPQLQAVLIPILACVIVSMMDILPGLNIRHDILWYIVVYRGLLSVAPGTWYPAIGEGHRRAINTPDELAQAIDVRDSLHALATADLWIGAVIGAALIVGAIYMRRWRDDN